MKFGIAESMCDIDHYLPLAQAADEAGFGVFSLGDSILYPEVARDKYPYTPTGDRGFLEGAPFLVHHFAAVLERAAEMFPG